MKKEVMTLAWEIAKRGAKRFGGSAVEYIAEAMKIAWGIVKSEQEETQSYTLKQWQAVEAKMRKLVNTDVQASLVKLKKLNSMKLCTKRALTTVSK